MSFQRSYYPNYYSIQDILATQERVPCQINVNLPRLGFLNPSAENDVVTAGTELELPLWLADNISSNRPPYATVEVPRIFREAYREILKADACAVDLYKMSMNFYEFGKYVRKFDESGEVAQILRETFRTRFRQLMDVSQNSESSSSSSVINKLDQLERTIYAEAHKTHTKMQQWLNDSHAPMQAAEMVVNHRKRKRAEINISDD